MTTDLDGVAQCRFGVRWARMDSRRRTTLSDVVVASMAEWPDKVDASVHALRMDRGKTEVTALCSVCVVPTESAPDRSVTQSRLWLGWDIQR